MQESAVAAIVPGSKVRLKRNPSRAGVVGSEVLGSGRREKLQVYFADGTEDHILRSELELDGQLSMSPVACISRGAYGSALDLRKLITHYRLTGKLANLIYSLNTTNTLYRAHQFKPVLQYLDSPCNGLLIADEVGLGKTIEAGLIWTELCAREEARRLLVVCPAMLRQKWCDELLNRFGVKAQLVDASGLHDHLRNARANPLHEFALVASMQGLRPPRDYEGGGGGGAARLARLLDDDGLQDSGLLDLLVIDEAHYLRNPGTQTNELGHLLRRVAKGVVLLSATPIQLHRSDLYSLVKLLDDSIFADEQAFEYSMRLAEPIVQLRDRIMAGKVKQAEFCAALQRLLHHRMLQGSQILQGLLKDVPSDEVLADTRTRGEIANRLDRLHPLSKLVTRTLKRDVEEDRVQRQPVALKADLTPVERAFYDQVTEQVRQHCEASDLLTGFILTIPQRQMASSMAAACRGWQQRIEAAGDLKIEETLAELEGDDPEQEYREPDALGSLVRVLVAIAQGCGSYEALKLGDSKYQLLIANLREYRRRFPGKKVVLFSFFRQTLAYLHERLAEDGISSVILQGGQGRERNQEILKLFEAEDGPDVLLSSEVASEGVDLQFSSLLVNYDLPWNPARIEQRIGRIDRIGQMEKKILIWNLLNADTIDERIHDRLLDRLDVFRQSLGRMESIIGDEIRKLTHNLLSHRLTARQERELIESNLLVMEERRRREEQLEAEAGNLAAHGDFILDKVRAARELGRTVTGEDIHVYVEDFLRIYQGSRLVPRADGDLYDCELSVEARLDFQQFLHERRCQGSTRLLAPGRLPLKFENRHAGAPAGHERVAQDHALVRFIGSSARQAEVITSSYRVSALQVAQELVAGVAPGDYAFAVFRWSFSGAVTRETLEYLVKPLEGEEFLPLDTSEQLVNTAAMQGSGWLGASNEVDGEQAAEVFDDCRARLSVLFGETRLAAREENEDRINLLIRMAEERLATENSRLQEQMERMHQQGKEQVVRMTRGKINALHDRFRERREMLEQKKNMDARQDFVAGGVLRVR